MHKLDPSFLKLPDFKIEDKDCNSYEIEEISTFVRELVFILKPNKSLAKYYYIKSHRFGAHIIQNVSDTPRNLDHIRPSSASIKLINEWAKAVELEEYKL